MWHRVPAARRKRNKDNAPHAEITEISQRRNLVRGLAEDVFYFVEDGGVAVGGLVFHFLGGAELLDQFALVARKPGRGHHADMIVQIAFAAAARVG